MRKGVVLLIKPFAFLTFSLLSSSLLLKLPIIAGRRWPYRYLPFSTAVIGVLLLGVCVYSIKKDGRTSAGSLRQHANLRTIRTSLNGSYIFNLYKLFTGCCHPHQ